VFTIDHLAFPCFDVVTTSRFYTEVLGGALRHAQSGPATEWNAKEYLLLAFELPGGVLLDFFSFDGIERPSGGALPKDIWHVALSVPTRDDVMRYKERFAGAAVPFWLETHEVDDVHVYATDPNGLTLEILAESDSLRRRKADAENARRVVARWLDARR
jgi:catechol 2,3-dioxygenase-like lactoylglutathione lyase family enzyme